MSSAKTLIENGASVAANPVPTRTDGIDESALPEFNNSDIAEVVTSATYAVQLKDEACDKYLDGVIEAGVLKGWEFKHIWNDALVDNYERCRPTVRSREWVYQRILQKQSALSAQVTAEQAVAETAAQEQGINLFFTRTSKPAMPVWDGVFDEGQIVTLAADWNLGKSPLIQQLGLCIATGSSCLGHGTPERPVIILDTESQYDKYRSSVERIAKRLRIDVKSLLNFKPILRYGADDDPESKEFSLALSTQSTSRKFLERMLAKYPNGVFFLDAGLDVLQFKAKDDDAVMAEYRYLKSLLAKFPHATYVLTLHLRKPDPKHPRPSMAPVLLNNPRRFFEEVSGSNKIGAHADVRLGMAAWDEEESKLLLRGLRRGTDTALISLEKNVNENGEYDGFVEIPIPVKETKLTNDELANLRSLAPKYKFTDAVKSRRFSKATLFRLQKKAAQRGYVFKDKNDVWHVNLPDDGKGEKDAVQNAAPQSGSPPQQTAAAAPNAKRRAKNQPKSS